MHWLFIPFLLGFLYGLIIFVRGMFICIRIMTGKASAAEIREIEENAKLYEDNDVYDECYPFARLSSDD